MPRLRSADPAGVQGRRLQGAGIILNMPSEMLVFAVAEDRMTCAPMPATQLATLGIFETTHPERWVVDHPEVLGDDVLIVTTQYGKWSSHSGDLAKERLDILGLDSSGQLVVVELKRGTDPNVHMQAITYAALVAGFSKATLAEAHAEYLNRRVNPERVSVDKAAETLNEHVDGSWEDDVLTVPKIILLAEDFTAQTYTTVTWLSTLTPNLSIEMHTVNGFVLEDQQPCIVFRRLFPAMDPSTRVLTPGVAVASAASVATKIADKKRRIRSTYILYDTGAIPEGEQIVLDLHGWIDPQLAAAVDAWVAEDPRRGRATWVSDRERPLRWNAGSEGTFTPTGLAKHVIREATGQLNDAIAGADVWHWSRQSLASLATALQTTNTPDDDLSTVAIDVERDPASEF
jgi:hypothetical protein